MAVPDFLAHSFRYKVTLAVTDVNTIISDLNAELVTNPAAADKWTDLGGSGVGPFKSPVAADGSYMKITLTRASATSLDIVVNDTNGLLVNNQTSNKIYIDAAGTTVRLVTGPDICLINSDRATQECFFCARLNIWPQDPLKVRASFIASMGPRNNAGTLQNQNWYNCFSLLQYGTSYQSSIYSVNYSVDNPATESHLISVTGAYIFMPWLFVGGSYHLLMGRVPQMLLVDGNAVLGTEFTVPVDVGVNGTFRVFGLTAAQYRRVATRIA